MHCADQLVLGTHDVAFLHVAAHRQNRWEVEDAEDLGGVEGYDLGVGLLPEQLTALHPCPPLRLGCEALVLHVGVESEDDSLDPLAGLVVDLRGEEDPLPWHEGVIFHPDLDTDGTLPAAVVGDLLLSLHKQGTLEGVGLGEMKNCKAL